MRVKKYDFGHSHGNSRKTNIVVNTDDCTINATNISIAVNLKSFTIRARYGDATFCFCTMLTATTYTIWGSNFQQL